MGQRDLHKAQSHDAIVQSAASLLRRGGGDATSVQRAMKGAGLTVGAFYAHFDDKAGLIEEAFNSAVEEMSALVIAEAEQTTGSSGIAAVIDQYLSTGHRDQPDQGCPLPALLGEAAHGPSTLTPEQLAVGVTAICDAFRRVDPTLTDAEAQGLLAQLIGGQIVTRALRGSPLSDEILEASRTRAHRQS